MNDMGHMSTDYFELDRTLVKVDPLDRVVSARKGFRANFGGREFLSTSSPIVVDRYTKKAEKHARKSGFELVVSPEAKESEELLYQWELEADECLRIGGEVENGFDNTFYRWQQDGMGAAFWQSQPDERSVHHSLQWLRECRPDRYSKDKAEKLVDTARAGMLLNRGKTLSQTQNSNSVMLGVRGAYLSIDIMTGCITAQKPTKEAGLTCCIPADFDWSRVGQDGGYQPRPLDPETYFGRFIYTFFPDEGVRSLLQECLASSFLPVCYEKCFVLYGSGSNGKSTFIHLLRALHPGPRTVAFDMSGLSGEYGISDFLGARNAICTECPKHIDDAAANRLKAVSSWDPVPLNRKYKDRVTIVARISTWLLSNHVVSFQDHSYGMQRRLLYIPFEVRMKPEDPRRITDYHKLITDSPTEMSMLMDWMLEGAARLVQRGALPPPPEAVRELARQVEQQTNPVVAFLEEEAATVSDCIWTKKDDVFKAFDSYCTRNGNTQWSSSKFWAQVQAKFHDTPYTDKQMTCPKDRKVMRFVSMKFANVPGITAMRVIKAEIEEKKSEAVIEKIFQNEVPDNWDVA